MLRCEWFSIVGRAMHQISQLAAAVYYYEKCLETKPSLEGAAFDLSREAAFNLALIYKANGSDNLAEHVLRKYIVI